MGDGRKVRCPVYALLAKMVAHWSFFCVPPVFSNPPPALLPECALNKEEPNYKGTQDVTSEGLPCLPWSGKKLLGEDVEELFKNESTLEARNYCRDPSGSNEGTYCYAISLAPVKTIEKKYCRLRKCKSEECRMAGTGNDYIGTLNVTRSNRTCDSWDFTNASLHASHRQQWNDTLFADMSATAANNYCRNPSRDVSGSWCYTTDPEMVLDSCNVRDCDRPEECIIIVGPLVKDRKVYILPQWKEEGLHGGLRFAIKEWNPDLLDGLIFVISPRDGTDEIKLQIGAESNEKIILHYNGRLVEAKTFPHIISAGQWSELWLQIRKGEIMLGFEGVPTSLFEWKSSNLNSEFEPMFLSYGTIEGNSLGLFFKCDECHTETISEISFEKYQPIGLWSTMDLPVYYNFSLVVRGIGVTLIYLFAVPGTENYYLLKMDVNQGNITFMEHLYGVTTELKSSKVDRIMTTNSWTRYNITFSETTFAILRNNQTVLFYESKKPILMYWFTISAKSGWVTWSANCEPLDLDGPPRDGGWSGWSPWTCTVSCGGGEGFRTRTCSNPHPNVLGKLCQGNPMSNGKCNDFPCGDVSPETLEKIRGHLQKEHFSYVIEEGASQLVKNNWEMLKIISKESPKAYYEWTLNGIFIKPTPGRIIFQEEDLLIKNAKMSDSGIYVCMLFRINRKRVVVRVVSLAVKSKGYDVDTRATRSLTLVCNSVVLGYIYTDLSMKLYLNDKVYVDHGITVLAAVNAHYFDSLNTTHTGDWKCVVEQKDLKLSWVTAYMRIRVKKAPNLYTNLMEDKLTSPLFGWLKTETNVLIGIIFIVLFVVLLVIVFLVIYFKFCTLKNPRYKRNRRL